MYAPVFKRHPLYCTVSQSCDPEVLQRRHSAEDAERSLSDAPPVICNVTYLSNTEARQGEAVNEKYVPWRRASCGRPHYSRQNDIAVGPAHNGCSTGGGGIYVETMLPLLLLLLLLLMMMMMMR